MLEMIDNTHQILTLPFHAIIRIARHTSIRTVYSLTQTCKTMHLILHDEFLAHRIPKSSINTPRNTCSMFSLNFIRTAYNDENFEKRLLREVFCKKKSMRKYAVWDCYGSWICPEQKHIKILNGINALHYHLQVSLWWLDLGFYFSLKPGCYKFRVYGSNISTRFPRLQLNQKDPQILRSFNDDEYIETECFKNSENSLAHFFLHNRDNHVYFELDFVDAIQVSEEEFEKSSKDPRFLDNQSLNTPNYFDDFEEYIYIGEEQYFDSDEDYVD